MSFIKWISSCNYLDMF